MMSIEKILKQHDPGPGDSVEEILETDRAARRAAGELISAGGL